MRRAVRVAVGLLPLFLSCSGGTPEEVPIDALPLGDSLVECAARLAFELDEPDLAACVYFEGSPCVLVADLAALGDGCGAGCLSKDAWLRFCPGDAPDYQLETSAGDEVPTIVAIAKRDNANAQPGGCTYEVPAACNGATSDVPSSDCLAQLQTTLRVGNDGRFENTGAAVALAYSGFVQDQLGRFGTSERTCPDIDSESCPSEASSCTPINLEVVSAGPAQGVITAGNRSCTEPSCTFQIPGGSAVDVEATAAGNAAVVAWGLGQNTTAAAGDCPAFLTETATTAVCPVTVSGAGQVTATFGYALEVVVDGEGHITATPGGLDGSNLDCTDDETCTEVYDTSATVVITAEQTQPDWQFSSWAGGPCDGTANTTCTVTLTENVQMAARFGYEIDLTVVGDGVIQMDPPGTQCGPDAQCVETYRSNQQVVLTATPNAGSVFGGWGNGPCTGTGPCTLTLTEAVEVTAGFAYEIEQAAQGGAPNTIMRSPAGLPCSTPRNTCQAHPPGESVMFSANPPGNTNFIEWQGCMSGTEDCTLEVQAATTVTAVYGYVLNLAVTGGGTVEFAPAGVGSCGPNSSVSCVAGYPAGTTVRLTASPGTDYALRTISGCTPVSGMPNACDVLLNAPQNVSAEFGREVIVTARGAGTVNSTPGGINCGPDCAEVYDDGALVTLIATPDPGSQVGAFTGCTAMGANLDRCQFSVTGPVNVTVDFGREVSVVVVGAGTVTSSPPGITCTSAGGAGCSSAFAVPSQVALTFTPASDWQTQSFTNCVDNSMGGCMIGASTGVVAVEFGRELTVQRVGDGNVITRSGATGIDCGVDCTEVFSNGRTIGLRATPGMGSALLGYTGCDGVNGADCNVIMSGPVTVGVEFGYVVDVSINGTGRVVSSPGDINCESTGGTCSGVFPGGSTVVLDAGPGASNVFAGWTGCTADPQIPTRCSVVLSQAASVTANFERPLIVGVTGDGTVTSLAAGINCGTDCFESYPNGTTVTLIATAGGTGSFGGWQGCAPINGMPNRCTVSMTAARNVAVTFSPGVTVSIDEGQGTVTSNPAGINCPGTCNAVLPGGNNVLTAVPAPGWVIRDWIGCNPAANPNQCVFSATAGTRAIHVRFGRAVTIARLPATTVGTVVSGTALINCGTECTSGVSDGSMHRFIAQPNGNFEFLQWSGCTPDPVARQECTLTANGAETVVAEFGRRLTTLVTGVGTVVKSPVGPSCGPDCSVYANGENVDVTATPASGWAFRQWNGCAPATSNPCTVAMTNPRTVTAEFGRNLNVQRVGQGSVVSAPAGINCGATCDYAFDDGAQVLLTANPTGNRTVTWSGCTVDAQNLRQCRVTIDQARSVVATFVDIRNLDIDLAGGGAGSAAFAPPALDGSTSCTADCRVEFPDDTVVTVVPMAIGGSTFQGFTDDCTGISCTLTMSSNQDVTLTFDP